MHTGIFSSICFAKMLHLLLKITNVVLDFNPKIEGGGGRGGCSEYLGVGSKEFLKGV